MGTKKGEGHVASSLASPQDAAKKRAGGNTNAEIIPKKLPVANGVMFHVWKKRENNFWPQNMRKSSSPQAPNYIADQVRQELTYIQMCDAKFGHFINMSNKMHR